MMPADQRGAFEARQRRIFEMIRDWRTGHELLPTLDELADALHVAKSTVHRHLQRLKDKRLVDFDKGKRRSTRATTDPGVLAAHGFTPAPPPNDATPSSVALPRTRRARLGGTRAIQYPAGPSTQRGAVLWPLPAQPPRRLPIAGRIAAGKARAFDHDEDVMEVSGDLIGPGQYTLRVTGDSMVNLGILDGDQAIVDPDQPIHEGDLVAALLPSNETDESLATIKVFAHRDGKYQLEAANPAYPPIPIDQNVRLGRVTTLVRRV
jgi:repressor LexA